MSLPEVTQSFSDGGLGIQKPKFDRIQAKIGVCSEGIVGSVNSFADLGAMQRALGRGKLVEAAAHAMRGGPVICVPVLPSVDGSVASTTYPGQHLGTGTVTGAKGPAKVVKVKIGTGGAPGVMTFQTAVGTGAYSNLVTSGADPYSYRVPKTLTRLVFGNVTYVANDVYQLNTDGTIARTGSGPSTALDGSVSNPTDDFDLRVDITKDGGLGVATFKYSLDGGNNFSGEIQVPSGATYVVPDVGVKLTFAGTFVSGDEYAIAVTGASFTNSDVTAALDALFADPRKWFLVHVVGTPTSAANSASLAAAVDTKMAAAEANFRYARAIVECPQNADIGGAVDDAAVLTAFASFASTNGRVAVAAGDCALTSAITGRSERRNAAWPTAARLSSIAPGEEAGWVGRGGLTGVTSLYRDERVTPALHDARFITLRTHIDAEGYYVTKANTMAVSGSDYGALTRGRVIDIAASEARAGLLPYLEGGVLIDAKTGFIDEVQAQTIEAAVTQRVRRAVVNTGDASAARVVLARNIDLLSTGEQPFTTRVVPLAYFDRISNDIGFAQSLAA